MQRIYSTLCLNGGGVKGAFQVGALRALDTSEIHTLFPKGVYGISVGAILGSLIAFKFPMADIERICREMHVGLIMGKPRLHTFSNLYSKLGLDSGERMHTFLKDVYARRGLDLDTLTIGDAAIPLKIIASDLTRCKSVTFNESVPVWDAIRASIALPLVLTPHILRGRMFVDGAVLCKNILKQVPVEERETSLVLMIGTPLTDKVVTNPVSYMMHVLHWSSAISELNWCTRKYPHNVCPLFDEGSPIDMNADTSAMMDKGESLCRLFLSKSVS